MAPPTPPNPNSSSPTHSPTGEPQAQPRLSRPKKMLFTGAIVLIGLLTLELGVRIRDMTVGKGFFNHRRNRLYSAPDSIVPFRVFGVRPYKTPGVITARWGDQHPTSKPPGTFRIVCMGGSTTEDKTNGQVRWPDELQRLLRERLTRDTIEVINIGNSAYATPHLLIHLELDVLSWQPDLIIACENINDLIVNWFPDLCPDYSNAYSDPYFETPDYTRQFTVTAALLQHFQLYWLLVDRLEALDLAGRCTIHRAAWGDKPLPGLDVFKRNWSTFLTIAKAHSIPVLLASQPLDPSQSKFDLHNKIKTYNWKILYPLHDEFLTQHKLYNTAIADVAHAQGALFLDNDAALGGKDELFMDHVHYTASGSRKLAESYANFIISSGIIR